MVPARQELVLQGDGNAASEREARTATQVVMLEANVRSLQRELALFKQKCSDLEQERAALVLSDDGARLDLSKAYEREQQLARSGVERRLALEEANNRELAVQGEAATLKLEVARLRAELEARGEEVATLGAQLREAQAKIDVQAIEVNKLRNRRAVLEIDCQTHEERRRDERGRADALQTRVRRADEEAREAGAKQAELAAAAAEDRRRAAGLREANTRLRLELQEALGQAVRTGEAPWYLQKLEQRLAEDERRDALDEELRHSPLMRRSQEAQPETPARPASTHPASPSLSWTPACKGRPGTLASLSTACSTPAWRQPQAEADLAACQPDSSWRAAASKALDKDAEVLRVLKAGADPGEGAPQLSPLTQLRSARARQLKQGMLDRRAEALSRIERLGVKAGVT